MNIYELNEFCKKLDKHIKIKNGKQNGFGDGWFS
jgi:hypothetical protein